MKKLKMRVPRGKLGKLAKHMMYQLREKIRTLGAEPNDPEPWEDDIVIYNNALLEQLEKLQEAQRRKVGGGGGENAERLDQIRSAMDQKRKAGL